jgi:hypothetical protein
MMLILIECFRHEIYSAKCGALNEANVFVFIAMEILQVESYNFHLFTENANFLPFVLH